MKKEKVIVVGANHGGTHAILTMADGYGEKLDIKVYDRNNNISFLGCGMALWLSGKIEDTDELFYANPNILKNKGVDIYMEHEVIAIDFDKKEMTVHDLKRDINFIDTFDKLILACGSWPIEPPLPGINLDNIHSAKIFQDAELIEKKMQDEAIKNVVVVGGGYIGVELCEAYKLKGKNVTLINDFDILNMYYDLEFQKVMEDRLKANGIKLALFEKVTHFEGENNKVNKVFTTKGEYEADFVSLSIGFKPRTKFLEKTGIGLTSNGAIKVNTRQETNIKDVYAIGDCATIIDNGMRTDNYIALATNAVRTGIVAGHNVGGTVVELEGVQGSNAIHIFGLTMCSTGLTEAKAKECGYNVGTTIVTDLIKPIFMKDNDKVTLKVVWDELSRRILGAQIMSEYDVTMALHMFSLAIQVEFSIDKLALLDTFFLPHFNQPTNFITKAGLQALRK